MTFHKNHSPYRFFLFLIIGLLTCSLIAAGLTAPVFAAGADSTPTPTPPTPLIPPPTPEPTPTGPQASVEIYAKGQSIVMDNIKMFTANEGWGISRSSVLVTLDGGKKWVEVTPPSSLLTSGNTKAYGAFFDTKTAWVIFSADDQISPTETIWYTTDGGITWTSGPALNHKAYGDRMWAEFSVLSARDLWVMIRGVYVGAGTHYDHQLFRSIDGGVTWVTYDSPTSDDYTGMVYFGANDGVRTLQTTGSYAPAPPVLETTVDGGTTWVSRQLPPPQAKPDLFTHYPYCETYSPVMLSSTSIRVLMGCFDYPHLIYSGYYYESEDGGQTWKSFPLPSKAHAERSQLIYFDPSHILVMGRNSYRSNSDGQGWTFIKMVNWEGQFSFVDPKTGWAIATEKGLSALVSTVNGGATWSLIKPAIAK
jgi:photosystem II stability/assembly factor-like uncharacterized protein